MKQHKLLNIFFIAALVFSGFVFAAEDKAKTTDPVVLLTDVTNNVLHALKTHHITKDSKPSEVYAVVDQYILPYVDFTEMSVWVAGKTSWGKASQSTRDDFVKQFKILVVRTYATALNNYSDDKVEFKPQKIDVSKPRIQISSTLKRAGKENIKLDYRLIKHGNTWLVYDVIIEGVSILQGFQAQFSDQIRKDGLTKVMEQIKEHNNKKGA